MTPTGSEFNRALFGEYLTLSRSEYNQGDYIDSDAYAVRARTAGQGGLVQPEDVSARKLPADKAPEITAYRGRLVAALGAGARERAPRDAAQAQANFDCWMEQQEENRQPKDIETCRSGFMAALAKIEVPIAQAQPESFTVYFDFNNAGLNAKAQGEVQRIVARARAMNAKKVAVEGFTDRSGSPAYNLRLSQKREAAVHDAIHTAGINVPITGEAYGETRLAKQTADGVREADNRRVTVTIAP
jgi:OOP family OmpA-OmpF porin